MQKTIAFDLDSTLADSTKIWCELYNLTFNQEICEADLYHWDIHTYVPHLKSHEETIKLFTHLWMNWWDSIPETSPYLGGLLKSVHDMDYRISIITNRHRETIPFVCKWLDKFEIPFDEITFINKMHGREKEQFPFNILLDDGHHNVNFSGDKLGVLFNKPWNTRLEHPHRVNTVSEFVDNYLMEQV